MKIQFEGGGAWTLTPRPSRLSGSDLRKSPTVLPIRIGTTLAGATGGRSSCSASKAFDNARSLG